MQNKYCLWLFDLSLQMGSNNGEEPSELQSDITLIDAITMPIHNEHAQEWMPVTHPMLTPATHPTSTEMDVQEAIFPTFRQKTDAYEHVVRELNDAREWHFPFKPATAFKDAYNTLGCDDSGKQVTMKTVWDLVQALVGEDSDINHSVSRKMS
ncbi:hypothetical protein MKX01_012276 [Papaver californicum]|nr:hypothetical protein MKX01_012276 [Papaver californicum]